MEQKNNQDGAQSESQIRSSAVLAGFVVEAICVNTETHKTFWKEIARYPDRETAESVVAINRVGEWRIREEQPANDESCGASDASAAHGTEKPMGQPGKNAESQRPDWWTTEPELGRVANGVACRVDRLRCIGNGQVPAVVELAWQTLGVTEDENADLSGAK